MAPPAVANESVSVMHLSKSLESNLPSKFVKCEDERPTVAHDDYCRDIPVISLKGFGEGGADHARVVKDIASACEEWGIFQIVDHGVSEELMQRMKLTTETFFNLPLDEKLKYASKPGGFPVGYASGSHRSDDAILDWRELMVHRCLPSSIQDPNMWPESPAGYRETLKEYSHSMDTLVSALLSAISEGLGLSPDFIKKAVGGDAAEQKILMNYYPQCPQPDLTLGLRSHTDYGTITVLQQDNVGGLQALKCDTEKWVTVEPIPNALVINLGDQIQILSNDKYQSVEHQAVVNNNCTRISIVTFANPASDVEIGPIAELLSDTNAAQFRNYIFKDYLPICFAKLTKKHYDALRI